jgi:hypothetical protein
MNEGRRNKEEGRRKKEEGRRKKEEGRRKKEVLMWDWNPNLKRTTLRSCRGLKKNSEDKSLN